MKALSLWQPWASLIAFGEKRVETRSWSTDYRGPIAIHASVKLARDQLELCHESPFCDALTKHGIATVRDLPRGAIIAMAEISDVWSTDEIVMRSGSVSGAVGDVGEHEPSFGNYGPKRFGFYLTKIRKLERPVPVKGLLGLWIVPSQVANQVRAQLPMEAEKQIPNERGQKT